MPVIHDVDAFSGERHHKSHKKLSMGCLPSRFVAFGTSWGVKLTNGAAALKGHPLFGLYASAAAEVFRRRGSHPFCWRYMLLKPNALRMCATSTAPNPRARSANASACPFGHACSPQESPQPGPTSQQPGVPFAPPQCPPWLRQRV